MELNALVQHVEITADRSGALERLCARVRGLDRAAAALVPYLMVGTVDQIVDHLHNVRQRWGISYFTVRDAAAFAPVLASLRARPGR